MKLNWGWSIVLALIGFGVFILYHVIGMMRENTDLITENYYNEELMYQERIEEKQRAIDENRILTIRYDRDYVYVHLPFDDEIDAELHFIHPERKVFDKSYTTRNPVVKIPRPDFKPGKWNVKCHVTRQGQRYLFEETVFL